MNIKTLEGFKDHRGQLFWFGKEEVDFDFKYITTGTILPKYIRGGHYHKRVTEKILCVTGRLLLTLNDNSEILNPGDVATIPVNTIHVLENIGNKTATFIELKSERMDENDMDTFSPILKFKKEE